MRPKLIVFAVLPVVLGSVALQEARAGDLNPAQSSVIDMACRKVVGLDSGESQYADCRDSLAHSLARKIMAEAIAEAADHCRGQGLAEKSAALSLCTLGTADASATRDADMQPIVISYPGSAAATGKSYFEVPPNIRWQRERYACASLGLPPEGGLFGECVSSLDSALLFPN